ncbi:MAG: FMN-binding protein [Firmicutes bacterium]|nr:FMN-binding protein [Bacillota bacterium]
MRDSLRLVIVLGLIATISGGVLAYVHQNMSPIIEENRAAAMAEAILEVMPKAVSYEVITAFTGGSALADATSSGSVADATSGSTEDGTSASTDGTSASTATDSTSASTDGTSAATDGTTASTDGATAATDGASASTDGTSASTVTDGTSASTDGTSAATDGTTASTDSATAATDGTSASTDGTSASTATDGTSASTDGTSGSSVVVDVVTKYRGLDADGNTVGIAFAVDGNGFGGNIRMMVGLDPVTRKLTKVKVLDHLETPGLGARITEQAFLHQFENKSLDDAFTAKNDVDAITGATVSSQAVAATIKAALSEVEADLRAGGIW